RSAYDGLLIRYTVDRSVTGTSRPFRLPSLHSARWGRTDIIGKPCMRATNADACGSGASVNDFLILSNGDIYKLAYCNI
ncbi:MAG: hypothetical protein JWQ84_1098, partial [Mucilaginibacter sp.]|nr:hypothetical protein [Mucilaginibacter sp.]